MGEQKNRLNRLASDIRRVADYVVAYQYCLRALVVRGGNTPILVDCAAIAAIGRNVIWPCTDGAVVLTYDDAENAISVIEETPLGKSINEFLSSEEVAAHYAADGRKTNAAFRLTDERNTMLIIAAGNISESDTKFYPRYQRGLVIGWDVVLPSPDESAIEDFELVYAARNILKKGTEAGIAVSAVLAGLSELVTNAKEVLSAAQREEDVQKFFTQNPALIYPEAVKIFPKYKLGKEYITDYVFQIQGASGLEYVFVEIESPTKQVFIANGQFSSAYTQAKDQLLKWKIWVDKNLHYLQNDLPGVMHPTYHLIMDRNELINTDNRSKLNADLRNTNRRFSTYDDLLSRFETLRNRLQEMATQR